MNVDLGNLLITVFSGIASALLGLVLKDLRSLRDKVDGLSVQVAELRGKIGARRPSDWSGDERRPDD